MRHGYTVVMPATRADPVPAGAAVTQNPNGTATVEAARDVDKRRLHMALFRRFGNRACWPVAQGRRWVMKINAPVLKTEDDKQVA